MTGINPYGSASFQGWDMWGWSGAGGADSTMPGVITGPDGTLQRPSPEAAPDPAVVITLSSPGTMPDPHALPVSYGPPGILTGTAAPQVGANTSGLTDAQFEMMLKSPQVWMGDAELWPPGLASHLSDEEIDALDRPIWENSFARAVGVSWGDYSHTVREARANWVETIDVDTNPMNFVEFENSGGGYFSMQWSGGANPYSNGWANYSGTQPTIDGRWLTEAERKAIESGKAQAKQTAGGFRVDIPTSTGTYGGSVYNEDGSVSHSSSAPRPIPGQSFWVPFAKGSAEADAFVKQAGGRWDDFLLNERQLYQRYQGADPTGGDGHLSFTEAVRHWRYGNGNPVTVDASKLTVIVEAAGLPSPGQELVGRVGGIDDFLVHGSNRVFRDQNGQWRMVEGRYNFDIKNVAGTGIRDVLTSGARAYHGFGTSFIIQYSGSPRVILRPTNGGGG